MEENEAENYRQIVAGMPSGPFSTADFIREYQEARPEEWKLIEARHGAGGRGAGQYRTVFTHVAHRLSRLARNGDLHQLDYRPAPNWWGNNVVQFWSTVSGKGNADNADAVDEEYREGALRLKAHLRRERHPGLAGKKKADFLANHGKLYCEICKLDPVEKYGETVGPAVIEVHHEKIAVGAMKANHLTKLSDLQCLCANCHRVTHAKLASQSI